MSEKVVFVRPVEKVGIVYDILKSCKHSNFPVVDTNDGGVLFGTIPRSALGVLLKRREFGRPTEAGLTESIHSDYLSVEPHNEKYLPIIQWEQIEKSYPKYPSHGEIRLTKDDRDCFVDLRPYANTAPVTVQEFSSVSVSVCTFEQTPDGCDVIQTHAHSHRNVITALLPHFLSVFCREPTKSSGVLDFVFFLWSTDTISVLERSHVPT